MDGMVLILIMVWIVLAVTTGTIAAERGRSMIGWFGLGLIFPAALLFALILPDGKLEEKMHKYYDAKLKEGEPEKEDPKFTG